MTNPNPLVCPLCQGKHFILKYEAAYIYSYLIDADAPGKHNEVEFLPFLYDNRQQTKALQYETSCFLKPRPQLVYAR